MTTLRIELESLALAVWKHAAELRGELSRHSPDRRLVEEQLHEAGRRIREIWSVLDQLEKECGRSPLEIQRLERLRELNAALDLLCGRKHKAVRLWQSRRRDVLIAKADGLMRRARLLARAATRVEAPPAIAAAA